MSLKEFRKVELRHTNVDILHENIIEMHHIFLVSYNVCSIIETGVITLNSGVVAPYISLDYLTYFWISTYLNNATIPIPYHGREIRAFE